MNRARHAVPLRNQPSPWIASPAAHPNLSSLYLHSVRNNEKKARFLCMEQSAGMCAAALERHWETLRADRLRFAT